MWKKVLREYFAFPKKERRGLWVLFLIWSFLLIYQIYKSREYKYFLKFNEYEIIVSDKLNEIEIEQDFFNAKNQSGYKKQIKKYFKYITEDDLKNSSLSTAMINKIIRARDNGQLIYTEEDLNSWKEIDSVHKIELKKFLKFFPSKKYYSNNQSYISENRSEIINLNLADTADIDNIKGVSKSLAKRIIQYRDKLGGYRSIIQLKEVWGMDSFSFEQVKNNSVIDELGKTKININHADLKTLGAHPYIGYKLAKLIINYREQHGNYVKVEDLYKIHVMNEEIFSKIETYITTQDD